MENRLIDIETRLAFQDDTIESLNQTVIRQQQQIERLELIAKTLTERMRGISETSAERSEPEHEIPPHY